MDKKVKLGLIGMGNIAARHLGNLLKVPEASVVAICDIDVERAKSFAQTAGARSYQKWEQMLENEELDGVLVSIPQFARGREVQACVEKGLAVFIEKPAAATLELAEANQKAIEKAGAINAIGYMWRSTDCMKRLRTLLAGRKVGLVHGSTISSAPAGTWFYDKAKSSGQIFDQSTHIINIGQALAGEAVSVFATGTIGRLLVGDWVKTEDVSSMSVRFTDGLIGSFSNTFAYTTGAIYATSFYGTNFAVTYDMGNNRLSGAVDGIEISFQGHDDPYEVEMRNFVQAVLKKDQSQIACAYKEGISTLKLTLAANRSLESGKEERV